MLLKRQGRARPALVCALVWCASITCSDLTSPSGGRASVGIAPVFSEQAAAIYSNLVQVGLVVDNVHLQLNHADGTLAKDTTVTIVPGQDSVVIEIIVDLNGSQEVMKATIDLRDGTIVLFSGEQNIIATAGALPGAPPPPIPVEYAGPGSNLVSIDLGPADTTIRPADSVVYRPTAQAAGGQPVVDFVLIWEVKDPSVGSISAAGVFKPTGSRGQTWVIARTPNGIKDSARVTFTPPAATISIVSGGAQSATVGTALAQPVVVEALAGDGLPVPAWPVNLSGGGVTFAPAALMTGADGRASSVATMPTLTGVKQITASSTGLTSVTANVTATPDKGSKLAVAQQPSASALAGTTLSQQPTVQVQDQFGNSVNGAGFPVTVALSGSLNTLAGTQTVASDAAGLVTYSGLKILGPPGSVAMTFSNDSLTGATSGSITVAVGPAANLALEGGSAINYVAGSTNPSSSAFLVTDAGGNGVPGTSVRVVATIAALTLYDTTVVTDSTGRVRLNRVPSLASAGVYTITASSGTLAGSPAALTLTVVHGPADRLRFSASPAGGTGGVAFGFQVDVADAHNNRVVTGPAATSSITVAIKSGTGAAGAVLGPSPSALTVSAVAGVATFSTTIDKAATGYKLTAAASGLTGAESNAFNIAVGPPALLSIVAGDSLGVLKGGLVIPVVKVRDAGANNVPDAIVTFTPAAGSGTVNGSASATDTTSASGQATANWNIGTSGPQSLNVTIAGLSVTFHAFYPETLVIVTAPELNPRNGLALQPQPKVQLRDKTGRQIKLAGVNVTVGTCCRNDLVDAVAASLSGTTTTATDANGESQFMDVTLSGDFGVTTKLAFSAVGIDSAYSALLSMVGGFPASVLNQDGDYLKNTTGAPQLVRAFVRDADGNGVVAWDVTFTVTEGTCTFGGSVSANATTNTFGTAAAALTLGGLMTSCTVQTVVVLPPAPPCEGECLALPPPSTYARTYRIPASPFSTNIWTGATGDDYSVASNWYDFSVPTGTNAFIPLAAGSSNGTTIYPTLYTTSSAKGLIVEPSAGLFLNGWEFTVADTLFADGAVHDGGRVVVTGQAAQVRGTVYGQVLIGYDGECSPTTAYVIGSFAADSILVNCELRVDENFPVTIGRLYVPYGRKLQQTKGLITVLDSAFFLGVDTLAGGLLDLQGPVKIQTDCEGGRFKGRSPHITRLSRASGDTLVVRQDICQAFFGVLEVATTNAVGATLNVIATFPSQLIVDTLRIKKDARLRLDGLTQLRVDSLLDVEENGVLRLVGTLLVGTCVGLEGEFGLENVGPFQCSGYVTDLAETATASVQALPPTPFDRRRRRRFKARKPTA